MRPFKFSISFSPLFVSLSLLQYVTKAGFLNPSHLFTQLFLALVLAYAISLPHYIIQCGSTTSFVDCTLLCPNDCPTTCTHFRSNSRWITISNHPPHQFHATNSSESASHQASEITISTCSHSISYSVPMPQPCFLTPSPPLPKIKKHH